MGDEPEFPEELIKRCSRKVAAMIVANDPRSRGCSNIAAAVLRESGHAELVAALKPFVSDHPITQFDFFAYRQAAIEALRKAGSLT